MSRNNHFSFQTLCPEKDGVCVASGTKPLEELSHTWFVLYGMGYKCSGSLLRQNNIERSQFFEDLSIFWLFTKFLVFSETFSKM